MLKIPDFETRKELFDFLVKNEQTLITQKKNAIKEADGFAFVPVGSGSEITNKAVSTTKESIEVVAVINTTNIIDSHLDLHLPKMWEKSLNENKMIMHVQEHKSYEFSKIIADGQDLKAYVKNYTWKQLGFNWEGNTQALMFKSTVKVDRNPFMFEQYAKGYVKNHSVGMRYVKISMCINDDDYQVQKENWDKYIKEAINPEFAESNGYFWAVHEAKVIEGSAVPLGSNFVTPTISVKADDGHSDKTEAERSLQENKQKFFNKLI